MSTTSEEDFALLRREHFIFERFDGNQDSELLGLLEYPHRWSLSGRFGGCSCHFRHDDTWRLGDKDAPTFSEPVDWRPEDPDDIDATKAVYDLLTRLWSLDIESISLTSGTWRDPRSRR